MFNIFINDPLFTKFLFIWHMRYLSNEVLAGFSRYKVFFFLVNSFSAWSAWLLNCHVSMLRLDHSKFFLLPGFLVKWQVLGLALRGLGFEPYLWSWSCRLGLHIWNGRKMSTSHHGRIPRFLGRIITKTHAIGTQDGTPVPFSDRLVRALIGCQISEIFPISWLILSDFRVVKFWIGNKLY